MSEPDLNLLIALDALLIEESVTGAARRLSLSPSAMSRTLARLRSATADPLLIAAGRRLVPTPHALALRNRVRSLVHEARSALAPGDAALDPATLDAEFIIRASPSFMETVCATLVVTLRNAAPLVRLRFVAKPDKDLRLLREGVADLEIGVVGERAPEVRTRLLFRDRFVGVARAGHPLLDRPVTDVAFLACSHVAALTRNPRLEPVDASLQDVGLARDAAVTVPSYPDAIRLVRATNLVSVVPLSSIRNPIDGASMVADVVAFDLPIEVPPIAVVAMWHPRLDADPAHRWLRGAISTFFGSAQQQS